MCETYRGYRIEPGLGRVRIYAKDGTLVINSRNVETAKEWIDGWMVAP